MSNDFSDKVAERSTSICTPFAIKPYLYVDFDFKTIIVYICCCCRFLDEVLRHSQSSYAVFQWLNCLVYMLEFV